MLDISEDDIPTYNANSISQLQNLIDKSPNSKIINDAFYYENAIVDHLQKIKSSSWEVDNMTNFLLNQEFGLVESLKVSLSPDVLLIESEWNWVLESEFNQSAVSEFKENLSLESTYFITILHFYLEYGKLKEQLLDPLTILLFECLDGQIKIGDLIHFVKERLSEMSLQSLSSAELDEMLFDKIQYYLYSGAIKFCEDEISETQT